MTLRKIGLSFSIFIVPFFISSLMTAQTQLWGMTNGGGQYGAGTIFSTDSTGNNETVQHSFSQLDGSKPLFTNLIQANDGMLYGMTYEGGTNNFGVLFQYDPVTYTYTKKLDFDSINGSKPLGSLLQANDGMLYGLAYKGGGNNKGLLFQYNPITSNYTKKFEFDSLNGCYPHGSLIQTKDGMFYGLTVQGGVNNFGVLFQYNPITSIYTKKLDFDSVHGSYPIGSLIQATDSMLYGYTVQGGVNNMGVLFQYNTTTNGYAKKNDFAGATNGNSPLGFLIQVNDTNLYGMTNRGGTNDKGVLFQYNPITSTYTKKIDFDSINGSYPYGSLMQASNGNIYGVTSQGGADDKGVLFQYNSVTSTYAKKFEYNLTNGALPYSSLIEVNLSQVGISKHQNLTAQISIFPNPNNGTFIIQATREGIYSIINALGQTVQSFNLNASNNYIMNIENLRNGIYFIVGFNHNYTVKRKIVVAK